MTFTLPPARVGSSCGSMLLACLILAGCAGESGGPQVPVRDKTGPGPVVAVPAAGGPEGSEPLKHTALERAARRAYDGAPPVIFHEPLGINCTDCHSQQGMSVEGLGFAPPSPHEETAGLSLISRCVQCHVYAQTGEAWVASSFTGLRQNLRAGDRAYPGAPPRIPHKVAMRENCQACHAGPAAREEIRCSHPERARCQQCHVSVESKTQASLSTSP